MLKNYINNIKFSMVFYLMYYLKVKTNMYYHLNISQKNSSESTSLPFSLILPFCIDNYFYRLQPVKSILRKKKIEPKISIFYGKNNSFLIGSINNNTKK